MKKGLILVLILAAGAAAGWGYYHLTGLPHYSLYRLKGAVGSGDEGTILWYINFDKIVENYTEEGLADVKQNYSDLATPGRLSTLETMYKKSGKLNLRNAIRFSQSYGWHNFKLQGLEQNGKVATVRLLDEACVDSESSDSGLDRSTIESMELCTYQVVMRQSGDRHWRIVNLSIKFWVELD